MKKSITILLICSAPLFAEIKFDAMADFNYTNWRQDTTSYTNWTNTPIDNAKGNAVGYLPYFATHVVFTVSKLVSFGVGPAGGFGRSTLKFPDASWIFNYDLNFFRLGFDSYVQLDFLPIIQPFLRFGIGYESSRATQVYKTQLLNGNLTTEANYAATYYNLLAGIAFTVLGPLSIYIQGGLTGSTKSSTFSIIETPVLLNTDQRVSYTGFMIGGGVKLQF